MLREEFADFEVKMKLGLETFDYSLRENILKNGIAEENPKIIANVFDEANFFFGIKGQSEESMKRDVELGLKYFQRICIKVMCQNTSKISPDKKR